MEKEIHIECVGFEELLEHPINSIFKNLEVCIYGIGEGLSLDIEFESIYCGNGETHNSKASISLIFTHLRER